MATNGCILVTGPTRSGKSEWAEQLALQSARPVIYVATAQPDCRDLEWQARLEQHRRRRPRHWQTREVPIDLAATLLTLPAEACVLVDSLGTWLTNLVDLPEAEWRHRQIQFLQSLAQATCQVILVAEETGWGVVPAYPLGRTFCDRMGRLTRQVGQLADPVYLVVAGHAIDLRRWGQSVPFSS